MCIWNAQVVQFELGVEALGLLGGRVTICLWGKPSVSPLAVTAFGN